MLKKKKKNMAYVHQLLDQPSQWQTSLLSAKIH